MRFAAMRPFAHRAGRARRGATLIGVSLMMIIAVGLISTYIRLLGDEAQQATSLEAADHIAQHAANRRCCMDIGLGDMRG